MRLRASRSDRRLAFTMIEILLVVGIIVILAVLALTVGNKVAGSAKVTATKKRLDQLDAALAAYFKAKGGYPPAFVLDPRPALSAAKNAIPIIDGQYGPNATTSPALNTVGLFLLQSKGLPEVEKAVSTLGSDALKEVDVDSQGTGMPDLAKQPRLLTVLDAWGNPIRYVHPTFHGYVHGATADTPIATDKVLEKGAMGAQLTFPITPIWRHPATTTYPKANADGGLTKGGKPYFYSAGPDGDPSTTDDNVYTEQPDFELSGAS